MPLGPIAASLASAAVQAGGSMLLGKLFGGGGTPAPQIANVNAGGLSSTFGGNTVGVKASGDRASLVGQIAATFPAQADAIAALRAQVRPGFGRLTEARVTAIRNARTVAIGDLKDNLALRRISGSSFAQDALTRADLAFAQQEEEARSTAMLQELDATNQLTNAEFTARRGQFQTTLDELNLEADVATKLAAGATAQLGANSQIKMQLDAQNAAGAGKLVGTTFAPVGDAVRKALTG